MTTTRSLLALAIAVTCASIAAAQTPAAPAPAAAPATPPASAFPQPVPPAGQPVPPAVPVAPAPPQPAPFVRDSRGGLPSPFVSPDFVWQDGVWPDGVSPYVVWPGTGDFAPMAPFSFAGADGIHAIADARLAQAPSPAPVIVQASPADAPQVFYVNGAASLYDQARAYIDRDQYDRALQVLNRLIDQRGERTDAAMYWKAYSQLKLARPADALTTLAALQKDFARSAWVDEARKLELEARQAAGQPVSADAVDDEELRLLALQGLMQNDPDAALPFIEKMLAGSGSVRLKDRALFVVSRSRSPRGREIITSVAKGNTNPDLRRSAIRLLGRMAGAESAQTLDAIYRGTADVDLKRAVLRGLMDGRATDRLAAVARSEPSLELRGEAVQYLGALRATAELEGLYRSESDDDIKRRILQGLGGAADKLVPIVRAEKNPQLRMTAIRQLGFSNGPEGTATLTAIYGSEPAPEVRKAVLDALGMNQRNAAALVTLARAEKDADLKTYIVRRLSTMRAPEAKEYMLELLK